VENKSYDEFGAAQIASTGGTSFTSSTVCNLRFPGQYFDAETGLHYNFHRYYDPALGRYITEDPIRDGLNWYAYAGSNPGNNVDPLGLCVCSDEEKKELLRLLKRYSNTLNSYQTINTQYYQPLLDEFYGNRFADASVAFIGFGVGLAAKAYIHNAALIYAGQLTDDVLAEGVAYGFGIIGGIGGAIVANQVTQNSIKLTGRQYRNFYSNQIMDIMNQYETDLYDMRKRINELKEKCL